MAQSIPGSVHIVDDEPDVRETIALILQGAGFATCEYATPEAFLAVLGDLNGGCIITDVNMPGMSGIELVRILKEKGIGQPVIVISGQAEVAMAVDAMKAGAIEFLEKPLEPKPLQDAVRMAISGAAAVPSPEMDRYALVVSSLTRRQRDVLEGVLEGLPNKLIAYRLGISIRTVEHYRAAIMDKTQAKSLSELVRMGVKAGL
ncbi:MAG: response regulator [Sphingomonadales bacterium]|nr:MAG: response regulator [Sphingomonadales bacterium]